MVAAPAPALHALLLTTQIASPDLMYYDAPADGSTGFVYVTFSTATVSLP